MAMSCFKTSLGWIGLDASAAGVRRLMLGGGGQREVLAALRAAALRAAARADATTDGQAAETVLRQAQAEVEAFLSGERQVFAVPVDWTIGTTFQRRVWRAAVKIPYGRVRSYGWVASKIGGRQFSRAVGMALGANPVPLIIPCHRIVAQDGSLGGFSCGLPIKRHLLRLEGTLSQLTAR